ncbi:glutamine--fructose-6-phosphate transaminase (isomerizing) [Pontivivens insulae]|uniref:Glutamine--fructose-6-phosphate aminotransferase [isomerizing] n=1 Tax=Pontivivens insulae TaxID=1639689 RepID=A0A2R8ACD4_9RHOB|nr:glutamine--fructose-6-phosphate transaminase (isomerizing) [Pontivivens insulae]RED13805.1 glucosamine--fructose-6-phosphate aminotransferase (isomerizing) [Pontivivens insulae]SPF29879.1 Glutamine--fructose-6-phosphate aminotransferase [isomerizing] [Pontivivens insulae]
MCGIIGILGNHAAAPLMVEALRRLEYRGYDSAGIATVHEGKLDRRRAVGKLGALADLLVDNPIKGRIGIGHTRWATHGKPTVNNAHPHQSGPVAVVHNGIIENFKELRAELADAGKTFVTETDTETVAMICAYQMEQGLSPVEAARATLAKLDGAFALCFLFEGEEDLMVAARKGSPLAVGRGDGEMFVGSDAMALGPLTRNITYLDDGDHVVVTRDGAEIFDTSGAAVQRPEKVVQLDNVVAERGRHKHFMAKEIHEQAEILSDLVLRSTNADRTRVEGPASEVDFSATTRLVMVACGTAFYACHVAKYWFEQLARIPVEIDVASEFRYREPPVQAGDAALFVSQSGETADTLAALEYCKGKAGQIIGVLNTTESSIGRASDVILPIHAGPEIGVASTKAFTCQLLTLLKLAVSAGRQRGTLSAEDEARIVRQLYSLPRLIQDAMTAEDEVRDIAHWLSSARDILFLGRGPMYPLALEGALKLKEISYIHAEGYASGELKHGPIALIDEHVPVIVFAPRDALFEKLVSNMQEVMARGGQVLLVTDEEGARIAQDGTARVLKMPTLDPLLAPIVYAIPAQLIAYHTAVTKGTDVDQPRNLAKSVTVE